MWVYRTTNFVPQRAVLFDFCTSRGGEHPQRVLQDFTGTLVTDDYSGYHKLQRAGAITGALCMAHARRKLFEAHKRPRALCEVSTGCVKREPQRPGARAGCGR